MAAVDVQLALPVTVEGWQPGHRACPACGQETPCACCQLWTGRSWGGYGAAPWGPEARTGMGRPLGHPTMVAVHRAVYEAVHGTIPDGGVVMHVCDTPGCYFAGHLVLGTRATNEADAKAKGRKGPRRVLDELLGEAS